MTTSKFVTNTQRHNFKRIVAQLDKTKAESKVIKIVAQMQVFLDEHDVGWDVVSIYVPGDYVRISERRRLAALKKAPPPKHANGHAKPALGAANRELLKRALIRHPDWEVTRVALGLDISTMVVADLIATAQLLGVDPGFVKLFSSLADEVTHPGNDNHTQET